MLKIAVLIKQVPLIDEATFDPATRTIRRDGPNVISAFDLRAIALAIELKNRFGADVTIATMGPPQAREALREALSMGADHAVHLTDRAFAGSDTLATARALAAWLKSESFDLVVLGKYSLDAETGQVGPEIAEMLGIPQITGVRKLELNGRILSAERESDEGYEEIKAAMPAVLTCAERVAQPIRVRPDAVEEAKARPIETVKASDIGLDPSQVGAAGSPTWVTAIRVLEAPKTRCDFVDGSDPERAATEVVERLVRTGALDARVRARRRITSGRRISGRRISVRRRDLWVVAETDLGGSITRGTLELLSRGDEMAARLGGALVAVGFPASITRHARLIASYGADKMLAIDSPALESYTPEAAAAALAQLIKEREPWGLLLSASERGRDFAPRLAARLELGLTGDAIGLEIDGENRLVALKPAFGGNVVAPILSRTYPQMATVRPGMLELAEPEPAREAEVEIVRLEIATPFSRLVAEHALLDGSIEPLSGAEVVVGVGTGVGGPEGVAAVKDFARLLGAGMCATRRVTDAGWVPRQLQVGLTGKAIEPRLYFAIGIRGAANHLIGIRRAGTVVAINSDLEAPIFERATIGLVADWAAVLPALARAFTKRLN